MSIRDIISPIVPVLAPEDSGDKALELMDEYHLTQLPLVNHEHYVALVQENDLLDMSDMHSPLSGATLTGFRPAVNEAAHPYDVARLFKEMNLSAIPVINNEGDYLGTVTRESLLTYLTDNNGVKESGGIIVLEMDPRDYSLSEIARICESNDIQIISMQQHSDTEKGLLQVTLKLNKNDMQGLIATFERFEYNVMAVFGENPLKEDLQQRYDLLMNYLNM